MKTSFSINTITLLGNISSDITFKDVGEHKIIEFSVATEYSYKAGDEYKKNTTFHRVSCFNPNQFLIDKLHKGSKVMVVGRQDNWSVKQEDGTYKNYNQVSASEIVPLLGNSEKSAAPSKEDLVYDTDDIPF